MEQRLTAAARHALQNQLSSGTSSISRGGSKHEKWKERRQPPSQHRKWPLPPHESQKSLLGWTAIEGQVSLLGRNRTSHDVHEGCGSTYKLNFASVRAGGGCTASELLARLCRAVAARRGQRGSFALRQALETDLNLTFLGLFARARGSAAPSDLFVPAPPSCPTAAPGCNTLWSFGGAGSESSRASVPKASSSCCASGSRSSRSGVGVPEGLLLVSGSPAPPSAGCDEMDEALGICAAGRKPEDGAGSGRAKRVSGRRERSEQRPRNAHSTPSLAFRACAGWTDSLTARRGPCKCRRAERRGCSDGKHAAFQPDLVSSVSARLHLDRRHLRPCTRPHSHR